MKTKRCPDCRARKPKMKFGSRRLGHSSAPFAGLKRCKNVFHGYGGWAR